LTGVFLASALPVCPKCGRPLRELGLRFSGGKIVPRYVHEMRGVEIRGELLGLDYACLDCEVTVHIPASPPPSP